MNSEEAAQMAEGKERSLLRITKAEIECPEVEDIHSETVYNKAVENYNAFQEKGWLVQDEEAKYYIYAQTMNGGNPVRDCGWRCLCPITKTASSKSTSLPALKRKKTAWC